MHWTLLAGGTQAPQAPRPEPAASAPGALPRTQAACIQAQAPAPRAAKGLPPCGYLNMGQTALAFQAPPPGHPPWLVRVHPVLPPGPTVHPNPCHDPYLTCHAPAEVAGTIAAQLAGAVVQRAQLRPPAASSAPSGWSLSAGPAVGSGTVSPSQPAQGMAAQAVRLPVRLPAVRPTVPVQPYLPAGAVTAGLAARAAPQAVQVLKQAQAVPSAAQPLPGADERPVSPLRRIVATPRGRSRRGRGKASGAASGRSARSSRAGAIRCSDCTDPWSHCTLLLMLCGSRLCTSIYRVRRGWCSVVIFGRSSQDASYNTGPQPQKLQELLIC